MRNMESLKFGLILSVFTALIMSCLFSSNLFAAIDTSTYWPVDVTDVWKSVYGIVTGLDLEDGDSVGMFSESDICYGAGLVRGGFYYLSAFGWEEANSDASGDFAIPGFKSGDKVIYKVYKKSTQEEYVVTPINSTYSVSPQDYEKYPPLRIDLAYQDSSGGSGGSNDSGSGSGSVTPGPDSDTSGSSSNTGGTTPMKTYYRGSLDNDSEAVTDTKDAEEKSSVTSSKPSQGTKSVDPNAETRRDRMASRSNREGDEDYGPEDASYPSYSRDSGAGTTSSASRQPSSAKSKYDVMYQETDKSGKPTEEVSEEKDSEETGKTKDSKASTGKKRWPLVLLVVFLLVIAGAAFYFIKKYEIL